MSEVIVADNQELYRAGIVGLLSESGYRLILQLVDQMRVHRALISNPNAPAIVSTTLIPDTRFLAEYAREVSSRIVLIAEDYECIARYRSLGFSDVIHRSASSTVLLERVRKISSAYLQRLPNARKACRADASSELITRLTASEQIIVALLMEGKKNRIIAHRLQVEEHVVRGKLQKIYDKTGFSSRLELVMYLAGQQLLPNMTADARIGQRRR